jgi:dienelactone hydrolase
MGEGEGGSGWMAGRAACVLGMTLLAGCAAAGVPGAPPAVAAGQVAAAQAPASPRLRLIERRLVEAADGEELFSLRFGDAEGREVLAYLRRPAARSPLPAVVLVAGRYAGREAVRVIPAPLTTVVVAVEYPGDIPRRLGGLRVLRRLPRMQATAEWMPDALAQVARHAAASPEVDAERIGLMGVSFGVPFAAIAGRDPVFRAVVLAYGGAGIGDMLGANLPVGNPLVRTSAAHLAARWLEDLEPERHVGSIAPKPLLLVNGIYDDLIPHHAAIRLSQAARPPVEHVWLPDGHIGVNASATIAEVAAISTSFFHRVWSAPPAPPVATARVGGTRAPARGAAVPVP